VKHSLAVVALLGAVVLPASPAAAACDVTVRITGFAPASYEVARGGTVTWCWAEGNHSVTGTFADSGVRAKDATFTHAFAAVGTFPYVCTVHESMTGQVVVTQAAATTPPVSQSPSAKPVVTPTTKPPATPAGTTSPVPRAQASTTPAVIPTSPPPSATPTRVLTTAPATTPPATTVAPTPSATAVADIDPAPAKPKTGLAIALGLVVAAGALGGAAWLLLRGRGA
jgi:fused signal recognition particle receptor